MGTSADFICEKCGFSANLNFTQPDCGFNGHVEQKFCPQKKLIALIPLKNDPQKLNDIQYCCNECKFSEELDLYTSNRKRRKYFSECLKQHPECAWEKLDDLVLLCSKCEVSLIRWFDTPPFARYYCPDCKGRLDGFSDDGLKEIYQCPIHTCEGIMRIHSGSIMIWD